MIPLTMSATVPIFTGAMYGLFARGRTMIRPSFNKLLFARNSPLQFIWFGGMIFCAAGVGRMVGCLRDGISAEGITVLAGGIGLILGSQLVV